MRYSIIFSLLLALSLLTGCVTSTVKHTMIDQKKLSKTEKSAASGKREIAKLEGLNSGVFLFYYIPLWSGKDSRPNRVEYKTFRNMVEPRNMRRMLKGYSRKFLKADDVENITIEEKASGVWTLWIFWKRSVHGTGTAVKYKK